MLELLRQEQGAGWEFSIKACTVICSLGMAGTRRFPGLGPIFSEWTSRGLGRKVPCSGEGPTCPQEPEVGQMLETLSPGLRPDLLGGLVP